MEEAWEMNMHLNPIDTETEETIKRHKAILMNHSDDFVAYIHHVESKSPHFNLFELWLLKILFLIFRRKTGRDRQETPRGETDGLRQS